MNSNIFKKFFSKIIAIISSIILLFQGGAVKGDRFVVTFYDYDQSTVFAVRENVEKGKIATPPSDPTRKGYIFAGWDGDYTNITSNRSIIAKYIPSSSMNVVKVSNAIASNGDTVTISVTIMGKVKICGYDMVLSFDSSALVFKEMSADNGVTYNRKGNNIYISYLNPACINESKEKTILTISFKVNTSEPKVIPITILPEEMFDKDDKDVKYTVINGNIIAV